MDCKEALDMEYVKGPMTYRGFALPAVPGVSYWKPEDESDTTDCLYIRADDGMFVLSCCETDQPASTAGILQAEEFTGRMSSAVQGGSVVVSYKPGGDSGDRGVQLYRLQGCKDVQGHGGSVRHFLFLARTAPDVTAEQVLESRAWHDVINGIGLAPEQ